MSLQKNHRESSGFDTVILVLKSAQVVLAAAGLLYSVGKVIPVRNPRSHFLNPLEPKTISLSQHVIRSLAGR